MLPIPELAALTVAVLAPYLSTAATEAAKKLGSTAVERLAGLYDKLKTRLPPHGQEALADLAKTPNDLDTQATFRQALKKQLAQDSAFHTEITALIEEVFRSSASSVNQSSSIVGNNIVNAQISGSGNQVDILGGKGE